LFCHCSDFGKILPATHLYVCNLSQWIFGGSQGESVAALSPYFLIHFFFDWAISSYIIIGLI